jgi:hypothetical protein
MPTSVFMVRDQLQLIFTSPVVLYALQVNLSSLYYQQTIVNITKAIQPEKMRKREGYGQRTTQYIILFVYLGFAAIVGIVWTVWYILRLVRQSSIIKSREEKAATKSK